MQKSKAEVIRELDREVASLETKIRQLKVIRKYHIMPYADYLLTPHWQSIRRQALQHYHYKCHRCGSNAQLEVHHKHYSTMGRESFKKDLEVLCRDCHEWEHNPAQKTYQVKFKTDFTARLVKRK